MNDEIEFKLKSLPSLPGVYLWKDKYENVIYVGKASNLYNRTHQYFQDNVNAKTKLLVQNIFNMDYIVTKSENDALILESTLINKYKPQYNILLKENNLYPYIVLTNDENPRLVYTRNSKEYKGRYFGPFAAGKLNKFDLYNLLLRIFPYRKCKTVSKRKCIFYEIGQCLGPCINKIDTKKYEEINKQLSDFFEGKTSQLLKELKIKELNESEKLNFEKAREYADLIKSINNLKEVNKTKLIICDTKPIDFIAFYINDNFISIAIHSYVNGKLLNVNSSICQIFTDENELIISYLMQYYLNSNFKPEKIYLDFDKSNFEILSQTLGIEFLKPNGNKFLNILNEALVNAESYYKSNYLVYLQKEERTTKAFNELKTITKIENLNLIHMFDMSNLYGIGSVGAMIALSNGEFNKNLYRKFIIKNQESKGDLQYFEEVITRQYKRTLKEETNLPNLIICDGGTNQINFTKEALKKIHLDEIIPVIGLVKDNNHKTDSIILQDGETVKLDKKTGFYNFLLNMQEEVHRFAIGFHRKKMINKIKEK